MTVGLISEPVTRSTLPGWPASFGPLIAQPRRLGQEWAGTGGRDDVPDRGLVEVVGNDRVELGHDRELALDDVAAAVATGEFVDEPDDAKHALAVDDAL